MASLKIIHLVFDLCQFAFWSLYFYLLCPWACIKLMGDLSNGYGEFELICLGLELQITSCSSSLSHRPHPGSVLNLVSCFDLVIAAAVLPSEARVPLNLEPSFPLWDPLAPTTSSSFLVRLARCEVVAAHPWNIAPSHLNSRNNPIYPQISAWFLSAWVARLCSSVKFWNLT